MLGKQAADLCTSTLTQYFVREYFAEGRWREYVDDLVEIYRAPPRRDARGAATSTSPPQATWTEPEGGLFIWATLPDYIDTGDLLAKALRADVAFVPGQAAYVDGRGRQLDAAQLLRRQRGRDPRGHPPDRQGDRRAGRALRDADRRTPAAGCPSRPASSRGARTCVPFRNGGGRREGRRPQGRPLARARRLAALRGAGRGRAGAARPRGAADRRRRRPGQAPGRRAARRRLRRHARRRRRGRHRAGAAGDPRHPLHRPRRGGLRALHGQGARPSTRCARPASRPPTGSPSTRPPSASSAPPTRSARLEETLGFPLVVKPSRGGSSLGVKFAGSPAEVPQALVSAFSYDDRVLLERFVDGRELAVSVLGDEALPVVEAIPREGDRYDFEARYEIGRTRFVCPAELERRGASARSPRRRSPPTGRSAAPASPAST